MRYYEKNNELGKLLLKLSETVYSGLVLLVRQQNGMYMRFEVGDFRRTNLAFVREEYLKALDANYYVYSRSRYDGIGLSAKSEQELISKLK